MWRFSLVISYLKSLSLIVNKRGKRQFGIWSGLLLLVCVNVNTLGLFIALGVPSGSSVNWFLEASELGEVDQGESDLGPIFLLSLASSYFRPGAAGGWVRGEAGTMTGGWEGGGGGG